MKVAIHGKDPQSKSSRFVESVVEWLAAHQVEIWISEKFLRQVKSARVQRMKLKTFEQGDNLKPLDFFLSIGGDGTLLESVLYVGKYETPILGINTGRLGFLATTHRDDMEAALSRLLNGEFEIDHRTVLSLKSSPALFDGFSFALNDFTIMKKDTSSMITVHVYVDNELLNSYWSDGLIVSTPTGSTGYSLSCGGPLVYPRSQSLVITPVSPHNLTARPIVIADSSRVTFQVEGRSKKFLVSLDSRHETIDDRVKLEIAKEKFGVKLVVLPGHHYFKTLRQKLNWGFDIRN
ncbi:MAG: NAD kinase [Bacteroidota bacterium]